MLPDIKRPSGIGKTVQTRFGGFDQRPEAADGTLRWTEGMTLARYPLLASREKRTELPLADPQSYELRILDMGGNLIRYEDGFVYYNDIMLTALSDQRSREMMLFGQKILFPISHEYLDLSNPPKGHADTAAELPAQAQDGDLWTVGAFATDAYLWQDGAWVDQGQFLQSLEADVTLEEASIGAGWYMEEAAEWNTIHAWDSGVDLRELFKAGDAVTIQGCVGQPGNNQTLILREVTERELRFYENSFSPPKIGRCEIFNGAGGPAFEEGQWYKVEGEGLSFLGDARYFTVPTEILQQMSYDPDVNDLLIYWIPVLYNSSIPNRSGVLSFLKWDAQASKYVRYGTVTLTAADEHAEEAIPQPFQPVESAEDAGIPSEQAVSRYYEYSPIRISRKWPEGLNGIFTDSNRVWGWAGHTLRASKLGDAANWDCFDGTAEDSWAVELQTLDPITAGRSFNGFPTFWTEKTRFRVYGNTPEAFQLAEQDCHGVREGCAGSLASIDGVLYYVSRVGVMQDSGSVPSCVSAALGALRLENAVGAAVGTEYWLSGQDQEGSWHTFVLDTRNGAWIRDSGTCFKQLTVAQGILYGVQDCEVTDPGPGEPKVRFWKFDPAESAEEAVASTVITNDYTVEQPNRKRVHRVQVRTWMEAGASLTIYIRYDGGAWLQVAALEAEEDRKASFWLPVLPRRCDHFALKLEGSGAWELHSLALETRAGSAVF